MATVASQPPMGIPEGVSVDQNFQPLNECGVANPFFYHSFSDDFDTGLAPYTVTGTGALAGNVNGGAVLLTTAASANAISEIQLVNSSFTVNILPKKLFYVTRLQMATPANAKFIVGLITDNNVTPFTAVADGIYFSWTGTALSINSAVGSAVTSVTIPAAAYTMANATNIDLAFQVTRQGDVLAFVDSQLVGYVPQSNIGTTNGPQNAGAVARITAPTMTAVVLNPTIAVQTGNAAAQTLTADFHGVFQER